MSPLTCVRSMERALDPGPVPGQAEVMGIDRRTVHGLAERVGLALKT